jgi:hypothetical protein
MQPVVLVKLVETNMLSAEDGHACTYDLKVYHNVFGLSFQVSKSLSMHPQLGLTEHLEVLGTVIHVPHLVPHLRSNNSRTTYTAALLTLWPTVTCYMQQNQHKQAKQPATIVLKHSAVANTHH